MSRDGAISNNVESVVAKLCVLRNSCSSLLHSGKTAPNLRWLQGVETMLAEAMNELQQGLRVRFVPSSMARSMKNTPKPSSERDYPEQERPWNPFRLPNRSSSVVFKGDLMSLGLSKVFQILSSENKTGILYFTHGEMKRAILLKNGDIIAASGNERQRLGQILYRRKLISQKSLHEALHKARKSGKRLGEMLLSLGFVTDYTLKQLIRQQVRETLWELSRWKEGGFEYREYPLRSDKPGAEDTDSRSIPPLSNLPSGEKKRRYTRIKVSWPAMILTSHGPVEGEVRDISLTGALLSIRELPNPNGDLRLAIEIPEFHYNLLATAEMIRLDIQHGGKDLPAYLLGVRFGEISRRDLEFLSNRIMN